MMTAPVLKKVGLTQLRPWLLATLLVGAVSWFLCAQILTLGGWQRAIWLKIDVDAPAESPAPPSIRIVANGQNQRAMSVFWDNDAANTFVGIQLVNNIPLVLKSITTDRGAVALDQVLFPKTSWKLRKDKQDLQINGIGTMALPGPASWVTIVLETGPDQGSAILKWRDQQIVADLHASTAGTYPVKFALSARYQGWALLPTDTITQLTLGLKPADSAYTLNTVTIFGDPLQHWSLTHLGALAPTAAACPQLGPGDPSASPDSSDPPCMISLPDLQPINMVPLGIPFGIWLALTALGLGSLALLLKLVQIGRDLESRYEIVEHRAGLWLRQRLQHWSLARVVLVVGVIGIGFHLAYAITVPIFSSQISSDSIDYYRLGRNLRYIPSFDTVDNFRTPGYPAFIALAIWLFGDQLQGTILIQHLALASLGPLVAWFLYKRSSPLFALLGGVVASTCPLMSITASILWTESLFCILCCLALFIFVDSTSLRSRFAGGLLVGAATMLRPNGIAILGVILAWLFLEWWCDAYREGVLRRAIRSGAAIILGYLLITAPWYYHFYREEGSWGTTSLDGMAGRSPPPQSQTDHLTSLPELAAWLNTFYQERVADSFASARPFKGIFCCLSLKNPIPPLSITKIMPWPIIYDDRFPGEVIRESIRQEPKAYLRNVYEALRFNLFLIVREKQRYSIYNDMRNVLSVYNTTYPIPLDDSVSNTAIQLPERPVSFSETDTIIKYIKRLGYRWEPPKSPLRSLLIGTSWVGMSLWWALSTLTLCSLTTGLLFTAYRHILPIWIFCVAMLVAPALIGMGVDRYVMILEPLYYTLICIFIFTAVHFRVRRRHVII